MAQLAAFLVSDGRPVLVCTGLAGEFDFENVEYAIDQGFLRLLANGPPMSAAQRPSLAAAIREQLGLELQNGRERIEVLAIESAQRPAGN